MTPFGSDFTIGVEEELLLVDPATGELTPDAAVVLQRSGPDRMAVDFELYAAQVEVRSGTCRHPDDVVAGLRDARSRIGAAGGTVIGCGLHPGASWGVAEIVDQPRYASVSGIFAGLMERTPEAALHVHIGMPDEARAIRVLNGLREYLPIFVALGANSPWWFGRDSHMDSARYSVVREYPTRRVPDRFASYEQYANCVDRLCVDADLPDGTFVYWDLRINPKYGTVEVREMDAQCSAETSGALAALVHATAVAIAEGAVPPGASTQDGLTWACFRAARDGLQARGLSGGARQTIAGDCADLLGLLRPVGRSLGTDGALAGVEQILRDGNGAARQRRVARDGGLDGLLRYLVDASRPPDRHNVDV